MPRRRTKRGSERTALDSTHDVVICGASFAGLATARELAGTGAAPTTWLEAIGLEDSVRQTFDRLVIHTPHTNVRLPLPWTFSTFDYGELCDLLDEQNDAEFETATVTGRSGGAGDQAITVET